MRYERDSFSIDAAIRKNRPLPDWFMDEPEIEPQDRFFIKAFFDLDTCRSVGMDIGRIPWSIIVQYSDRYKLDEDVSEAFVDIIREMDNAFLKWNLGERERHKALNTPKGNRRPK